MVTWYPILTLRWSDLVQQLAAEAAAFFMLLNSPHEKKKLIHYLTGAADNSGLVRTTHRAKLSLKVNIRGAHYIDPDQSVDRNGSVIRLHVHLVPWDHSQSSQSTMPQIQI